MSIVRKQIFLPKVVGTKGWKIDNTRVVLRVPKGSKVVSQSDMRRVFCGAMVTKQMLGSYDDEKADALRIISKYINSPGTFLTCKEAGDSQAEISYTMIYDDVTKQLTHVALIIAVPPDSEMARAWKDIKGLIGAKPAHDGLLGQIMKTDKIVHTSKTLESHPRHSFTRESVYGMEGRAHFKACTSRSPETDYIDGGPTTAIRVTYSARLESFGTSDLDKAYFMAFGGFVSEDKASGAQNVFSPDRSGERSLFYAKLPVSCKPFMARLGLNPKVDSIIGHDATSIRHRSIAIGFHKFFQ